MRGRLTPQLHFAAQFPCHDALALPTTETRKEKSEKMGGGSEERWPTSQSSLATE